MPFDFKKEYRAFYLPKNTPQIVTPPVANFLAVRGVGDPNAENGAYKTALNILYAVAYTLKMSYKTPYRIDGFFEYIVPPLESFWYPFEKQNDKSAWQWISVIRLPDFITPKDFAWGVETASNKKKIDCRAVEFLTIDEGLCIQIMHIGSYDDENKSIQQMDDFIAQHGYVTDFNENRLHHEIYLSDPRKTLPEKLKTVIRVPIRKV